MSSISHISRDALPPQMGRVDKPVGEERVAALPDADVVAVAIHKVGERKRAPAGRDGGGFAVNDGTDWPGLRLPLSFGARRR